MDLAVFHFINGFAGRLKILDWFGIFLADYLGYLLIFFFLLLLLKERNWRYRIYFFSLALLSVILSRGIITEAIRFFYSRLRPFEALGIQPFISHSSGDSFPSGHAAFFFSLALAMFYLIRRIQSDIDKRDINKQQGWWFLGIAAIIGIARIFAGVHWPSDIIGGAVIGLISVILIKKLLPSPEIKDAPAN